MRLKEFALLGRTRVSADPTFRGAEKYRLVVEDKGVEAKKYLVCTCASLSQPITDEQVQYSLRRRSKEAFRDLAGRFPSDAELEALVSGAAI